MAIQKSKKEVVAEKEVKEEVKAAVNDIGEKKIDDGQFVRKGDQ